ncbi:MAG: hypothetical protein KC492_24105 [Myxococcales bacterium]|nr:hypothetical protein [Myxococcales bacterium]
MEPMLTERELSDACAYGETLRIAVHNKVQPANDRARVAASCFSIAMDHHHAIIVLLGSKLYASCFALLRILFEACVRGAWLMESATDAQVRSYLDGTEPPKIRKMTEELEKSKPEHERWLSVLLQKNWQALCGYTHTGGIHVQRWNTAGAIEPAYSREEIVEALRFADGFVAFAVLSVLRLVDDTQTAQQGVLERLEARMDV